MARTFRRKRECHEYYWVLHDWESFPTGSGCSSTCNPRPGAQSDRPFPFRQGGHHGRFGAALVPQGVRPPDSTGNDRMLRRWLVNPEFDPMFRAWHKHDASWSWW